MALTTAATRLFDNEGRDLRLFAPATIDEWSKDAAGCIKQGKALGGLDMFTTRGVIPPWKSDGLAARARGYTRYEQGDIESILTVEPRMRSKSRKPGVAAREFSTFLRKATSDCGGWVMPKFTALPDHDHWADNPMAQLRPDSPVRLRAPRTHDHRKATLTNEGKWIPPLWGWKPGTRTLLKTPSNALLAHEAGPQHVDPKTGELRIPTTGRHTHEREAKYLLTPGEDEQGRGSARRMDLNPLLRGVHPAVAVICLEGTPKTDAITEAGWWCAGTPSVNTWDGGTGWFWVDHDSLPQVSHELSELAERFLVGVPTIVVCDSDWHTNPAVKRSTRQVVFTLLAKGAVAVAAAPPEGPDLGWTHGFTGQHVREKIGVDDWLGAGNEFLDIIARLTTNDDARGIPSLEQEARNLGWWEPRRDSLLSVARELGGDATDDGLVVVRRKALMLSTGLPESTVKRRLTDLREMGAVEQVIDTEKVKQGDGWVQSAPTIRLRADLRIPDTSMTVREWLAGVRAVPQTDPLKESA
jgi:hypothetical protein